MPNPNNAGRQPQPPFYTREQLDALCEQIITQFCIDRYGPGTKSSADAGTATAARRARP
jgi:hypothetical protein